MGAKQVWVGDYDDGVAIQTFPRESVGWATETWYTTTRSSAKCEYCGRYGELGQCQGCGAPNRPFERIEITTLNDTKPRYLEVWR